MDEPSSGVTRSLPFSSHLPPFYSDSSEPISVCLCFCVSPCLCLCFSPCVFGSGSVSRHTFSRSFCMCMSFSLFSLSVLLFPSLPPSIFPLQLSSSLSLPLPSDLLWHLFLPVPCGPDSCKRSCGLLLDQVRFPPAESLSPVWLILSLLALRLSPCPVGNSWSHLY